MTVYAVGIQTNRGSREILRGEVYTKHEHAKKEVDSAHAHGRTYLKVFMLEVGISVTAELENGDSFVTWIPDYVDEDKILPYLQIRNQKL